jgi:predicted MFS family arabinose efflux permease
MKRALQSSTSLQGPLFAVSAVALIAATYGLARLGYGLFLPAFAASFSLSPTMSGILSAGASLLYCVSAVIGFRFAGGHPRVVTLLAGSTAALGSVGIAGAQHTVIFAGAVLLAGMGAGFASPALVELVQRNTEPARQGRLQSIVNSGTGFGVVAAGILSLSLGEAWRIAWVLVAAIAAVSMLAVLRLDGSAGNAPERVRPAPSLLTRSSFHGLARPLSGAFVFGCGCAAVWVYGRATLEQTAGMSAGMSAVAWIALGVGGAAATLGARWLADHAIALTWSVTTLGTAGATALIGSTQGSLVAVYAAAALFGLAYTAATSVLILWASEATPDSAAATSLLFTALVLGQAAGAPLTGAMIEASGPTAAFSAAALTCAAGALAVTGTRPRVRPPPHR